MIAQHPEGRFTEDVKKRRKSDETQEKLEYQSDKENNEKMDSEENESSDNYSEDKSINRTRNNSRTRNTADSQVGVKEVSNGAPEAAINQQLQALTLNYAINALQNPMNPLLFNHSNTDLLALTKTMLMFSSWRNSENFGDMGERQRNGMPNPGITQVSRMNESAIANYLHSQHKN